MGFFITYHWASLNHPAKQVWIVEIDFNPTRDYSRANGSEIMRIAVMGSGAVGGYFGAKLAAAGHQVAFIARGKHLAALQAGGLKVTSPNGDLNIRQAQFSVDPHEVGEVELILFCVKSYDTEPAADAIKPMVSDNTTILSLQNGIDNPAKLARVYGAERILPAVVYVGAQVSAPGVIRHSNGGRINFGQMDSAVGGATKALGQTLTEAGIPCQASENIRKLQWTKLLWNAAFCAISCLARANTKQIVESPSLTQLALDCMAEVQAAARTQRVELARQQFDDTIEFSKTLADFKPSMLQDLEANKPLEYAAFNGTVVNLLEAAGEPAPINKTFYATLKFLDDRIRAETRR
jgi:2-dehydropantoate 2-reductase